MKKKKYTTPETDTFRLELSDCIAFGNSTNQEVGDSGDMYSKGAADWETEDGSSDW